MKGLKTTTSSVLAIGLLAVSFSAALAQDDAAYPTDEIIYVTGEMSSPPEDFKGPEDAKVEDVMGGFRFENAITWDVGLEFTDPRLTGKLRIVQNGIMGPIDGGEALVMPSTFHMVGDLCEWVGEGVLLSADLLDDAGEFQEELIGTEFYSMAGQGDCAGLTAYLITSFHGGQQPPSVEGLIFPSDIPAMPVPASDYTP
jgi:hypothetical protein